VPPKGGNFVLTDKTLSFSFREPYDFLAQNRKSLPCDLSVQDEVKQGCLRSKELRGQKDFGRFSVEKDVKANSTLLAAGEPPNFGGIFQESGFCKKWRSKSNIVRFVPPLQPIRTFVSVI